MRQGGIATVKCSTTTFSLLVLAAFISLASFYLHVNYFNFYRIIPKHNGNHVSTNSSQKADNFTEEQLDAERKKFKFIGCNSVDRWIDTRSKRRNQETHAASQLVSRLNATRIVHFVASHRSFAKKFTFKNYISLLSAWRFLEPDEIYIYLPSEIQPDKSCYHHWFEEALNTIPFLHVNYSPDPLTVLGNIQSEGGFVLPLEGIIFGGGNLSQIPPIHDSSRIKLLKAFNKFQLISDSGMVEISCGEPYILKKSKSLNGSFVLDDDEYYGLAVNPNSPEKFCYAVPKDTEFYPADIMTGKESFARVVRSLFYGTPQEQFAKPADHSLETLVPLICHYVWITGSNLEFDAFLSMLSCLNILGADIYVHGIEPPSGWRWAKLLELSGARIRFIKTRLPEMVYGNMVWEKVHISDVWRVEALLRYGGIYVDWDAVFLKPLDPYLLRQDAVLNFDIVKYPDYPEVISNGVMLAKPGSFFFYQVQKSMKDFRSIAPGLGLIPHFYNSLFLYYKTYECYPDSVYIEPHLQVICYHSYCHPTWLPNYTDLTTSYAYGEWDNGEAYAIHNTSPVPFEFQCERNLMIVNTTESLYFRIATKVLKHSSLEISDLLPE